MTWIELHGAIFWNAKVVAAAKTLTRGDVHKLVGHLAALWTWAIDNAETGELGHLSPEAIATAAGWRVNAKASRFVDALTVAGLLERDGSSLRIDNWHDYAGKLVERRRSERLRKAEERKRQDEQKQRELAATQELSAGSPPQRPQEVRSLPDQTGQDQTYKSDVVVPLTGTGSDVDRALVELRSLVGYRVTSEDERMLTTFAQSGVDIAIEVVRWVDRARRDMPRHPRAALRGWLRVAAERVADDREELAPVPRRTLDELLALKAAGGAI